MKRDEEIRMLLHPEEYTDEQLDKMLDETNATIPDVDKEWNRFQTQHIAPKHSRSWMQAAAIFAGVLMLSGIAYATIQMAGSSNNKQETVKQEANAVMVSQQTITEATNDSTTLKPVVFEDAELGTILNEIATFNQLETVYKKEASKHIRLYFTWDKTSSIDDIIDTFNKFERIHMTREDKKLIVE